MGRTQHSNRSGRTDKLAEAHDRLAAAVEALVSGDDWQSFLTMGAKLHGYSANNILLILSQAPWASQVAGYQTWKQLGRQVRAGAKGIAILAPCRYRSRSDDNDDGDVQPEAQPGRTVLRGFRVVHVFDISQTDGPEMAEPLRAQLLQGEAPEGLWDALVGQIADAGYVVERGDCDGANGRTCFATHTVTVRPDVDDAQAAKTLCHELAHIEMHDGSEYAAGCRGRAEVEAESVAYLVCHYNGLASDDYSFAYVAGWTGGDLDTLRATAERVLATARRIIDRLDDTDPAATVALAASGRAA